MFYLKYTQIHGGMFILHGLNNICSNAWKRMLYLKRQFSADIVEKIMVAVLLAGVIAVSNLQKGGNMDE
jgi:hypothetical protein